MEFNMNILFSNSIGTEDLYRRTIIKSTWVSIVV